MFGIVLWANKDTGSALVWCEDQRELALLDAGVIGHQDDPSLSVDDHLFFELDNHAGVRRITKVLKTWAPGPTRRVSDLLSIAPCELKAG